MTRLQPLPVDETLPHLVAAVRERGCAVLHAPPGAGKTTRVPPALAEDAGGRVVVLEPRRVAARAAARRIAAERGWRIGDEVGWWIRFERRFRPDTRVVFATEGVLLRWLQADPLLDGVATLVFDEFHERTLAADLSLALARRVRRDVRPDLRIVVMSATLDVEPLAAYLEGAPVIRSEGRLHPVTTELEARPDDRPLAARVASAARRALAAGTGDVLVFLPGKREIREAGEALAEAAAGGALAVLPLHGELTGEEQDTALRRGPTRRVVLATNVAETSVTVEGVEAVIDSGLVRRLRFDPATGLDRLETVRVSRASAEQRAGRAGREGPGACFRLWTAADDLALRPFETPEIQRVDLAGAVLELAAWGEPDPQAFEWYEAPEPERIERAIRELRDLGATDRHGLTALGRRLAALPLPPRLGRLVVEGEARGVAEEAALAAALLADRDPVGRAATSEHRAGTRSDLLDRLERLDPKRHPRVFDAQRQILNLLKSEKASIEGKSPGSTAGDSGPSPGAGGRRTSAAPAAKRRGGSPSAVPHHWKSLSSPERGEALLRAVAAAYLDRLCRRREAGSDRAVMVGGKGVRLGRSSAVRDAELFVAVELDAGRAGARSEGLVHVASAVEREWLPSELLSSVRELSWDPDRERVVARAVVRFEDLVLEEKEVPVDDPVAASALLASRAAAAPERALALDDPAVAGLLGRLRFLARALPELELPEPDLALLVSLLPALCAGIRSFAELRRRPLSEALLGSLDPRARRALEREAPERLEVPSGSRIRLDYSDPERPVLAARIQELFGLAATPRLASGRVPVVVHLLAPNGRPQQVTPDLASFWANTYPVVRRELAGRYPKHAWPEDPLSARAERRPRRR
jgi:ATP-dependent helicase HrpB